MIKLLKQETRVARKDYICDASVYYIFAAYALEDLRHMLPEEDFMTCFRMYEQNYKIKKGQSYIYQTTVDGGEFSIYRADKKMHQIAVGLDLFDS